MASMSMGGGDASSSFPSSRSASRGTSASWSLSPNASILSKNFSVLVFTFGRRLRPSSSALPLLAAGLGSGSGSGSGSKGVSTTLNVYDVDRGAETPDGPSIERGVALIFVVARIVFRSYCVSDTACGPRAYLCLENAKVPSRIVSPSASLSRTASSVSSSTRTRSLSSRALSAPIYLPLARASQGELNAETKRVPGEYSRKRPSAFFQRSRVRAAGGGRRPGRMEHVRSGLRLVSHAAVGVGAGSLAAVSTVLPSTGGAIDLIAVKQRDGSLKCSPFYVRFGKYQGLIRGREKVVTVTVNGVLMDFTMRLGRSGEAFFVVYDPDNPEAGLTANGSESEGESDDDEPEVTGAASVGTDPAARAEPGSRSSEGSDEETTHPYLRSQASVRRRLGIAADGGDGTEARSRISEEEDEDGDGGAQVATLDDLKHLAEARGTPNQTLDELREVASALEAEERFNGSASQETSRDPRTSFGTSQSIGGLLPERPKLPSLGSSPAKDNGWGWLGWRGNKNVAGAAQPAAVTGGSVSAANATMPSTSVADPSTPRSVASSASTVSEAAPFGRVTSRPDLLAVGTSGGTKIAVPPYDRGYLSEAEAEVALTGQLPEPTRAGRRPMGRSEPPVTTTNLTSTTTLNPRRRRRPRRCRSRRPRARRGRR